MNAEQYRALVNRLEAINEAEESFPTLKIGDIDPRNGKKILDALVDGSGNVVRSRYGDIWNVKYGPADAPAPTPEKEPEAEPVAPEAEPEKEPVSPVVEPEKDPVSPEVAPTQPCGPEVKEKIKQQKTFNAAYAMAKQAGCPDFDWCQIVRVPGQGPSPTPIRKPDFVTTNPMGDFDPTSFNGQAAAREDIELEESAFVLGDIDLDRIREIAGTQVLEMSPPMPGGRVPSGSIPEIKASSKEAAIAIARKKGIKVFKFCGKYKVQAKKRGQGPSPTPIRKPDGKVDFTGQSTPLGGDKDNPMSFAPNSNFGA